MNAMELSPETRGVLDRIRHSSKFLSVFEMPADLAEAAVREIGKLVLEDKAVPLVQQNGYRWYLRELSKLLRTKTDWDLALELEICLRKWVGYGLDPELLQMLLRECYDRIGAMTPEEVEEKVEVKVEAGHGRTNGEGSPRKHESHEKGSRTGTLESSSPGVPQPVTMDE